MTKVSTEILKEKLEAVFDKMFGFITEAPDISKLYWTEVNTDATYSALAAGDAATFSTKLTKQEVQNALSIAEQLDKFFQNQALTQADYLQNIQGIRYGNDPYTSPGISVAIEAYGERVVTFANDLLTTFKNCQDILDIWFSTGISSATGSVSTTSVPWYSNITRGELNDAITLVENFKELLNNEIATSAAYEATVSKFRRIFE